MEEALQRSRQISYESISVIDHRIQTSRSPRAEAQEEPNLYFMNQNSVVITSIVGLALVAGLSVYALGNIPAPQAEASAPISQGAITPAPTDASSFPAVHTSSVNTISRSTAALRGTVQPNGGTTNYWFEYGTDSLLNPTSLLRTNVQAVIGSLKETQVMIDVSGLKSNTQYYYRLVAQNSSGTVYATPKTFKTK